MAWTDVECSNCGETYEVQMYGPRRDREWKQGNWNGVCDDCREELIRAENEASATANKTAGLPSLAGSEKQIAWAETIRRDKLEWIKKAIAGELDSLTLRAYWGDINIRPDNQLINAALDLLKGKASASWWIDNRDCKVGHILENLITENPPPLAPNDKTKEVEAAAKAEATVRPGATLTETVAEIRIHDNAVDVVFPEKREDFWEIIKKQLKYSWTGKCWRRDLKSTNGTANDRAAETGHRLLAAGFVIRIFDEKIREMAVRGGYKKECRRWIMTYTSGEYTGWFCIQWPYEEDFYKEAKRLHGAKYSKPHVVVPGEQFEEVLDFAHTNGFQLSDGAEKLSKRAMEEKSKALVAHVEEERRKEIPPSPGGKPLKLEAPENVEIDDEFKDTAP